MIPNGTTVGNLAVTSRSAPSLTWRLDMTRGRIAGMTDGLEAIRQAVFKVLQTARFRHVIYSADYGSELHTLIGRQPAYVRTEAERMLREALLQDGRITDIRDLQVAVVGDKLTVTFGVVTVEGQLNIEEEVNADV
ncbi:DUF2634 domain-containing protein [Paenibacillus sp. IB182496]|uniref:DUF2634 domain-containing protein n=1 Tax=Paenibacillus sabuli TaxID=2772509 RepID=A0A927BUW9_9BACL|nr:DUF2634 domain-containing protein [Paenibacillus sabuli]MBD2846185.1 DUF2634 domain-containing protein [Paenibacillus sabuli]